MNATPSVVAGATTQVEAILYVSKTCPHCQRVLQVLRETETKHAWFAGTVRVVDSESELESANITAVPLLLFESSKCRLEGEIHISEWIRGTVADASSGSKGRLEGPPARTIQEKRQQRVIGYKRFLFALVVLAAAVFMAKKFGDKNHVCSK